MKLPSNVQDIILSYARHHLKDLEIIGVRLRGTFGNKARFTYPGRVIVWRIVGPDGEIYNNYRYDIMIREYIGDPPYCIIRVSSPNDTYDLVDTKIDIKALVGQYERTPCPAMSGAIS